MHREEEGGERENKDANGAKYKQLVNLSQSYNFKLKKSFKNTSKFKN